MTDRTYIFINSTLSKDHKAQSLINNYTNNCIIRYQYKSDVYFLIMSLSYKNLTLPNNRIVYIYEDSLSLKKK